SARGCRVSEYRVWGRGARGEWLSWEVVRRWDSGLSVRVCAGERRASDTGEGGISPCDERRGTGVLVGRVGAAGCAAGDNTGQSDGAKKIGWLTDLTDLGTRA